LAWLGLYAAWILLMRLFTLTFITYFVAASSNSGHAVRFDEISDTLASHELNLFGVYAISLIVLIYSLNPLNSFRPAEFLNWTRARRRMWPGFVHGGMLAMGLTAAFLLSGAHRYLGFFIQLEDVSVAIAAVITRTVSLLALVYAEEFIFRDRILNHLKTTGCSTRLIALLLSIFYCLIKMMQFDLGAMQLLTLFLLSISLTFRAMHEGDFLPGAGFWGAILLVFHPLLSLPVFGSDFSGLFFLKYQVEGADLSPTYLDTIRFVTGGAGGPLSSLALQAILAFDLVRTFFVRLHRKPC
jgi:hypothetical protein